MSRFRPFALALVLTVVTCSCGFSQTSATAPAPTPMPANNAVAATVNGQPILEVVVERAMERVPAAKRAEVRAEMLNEFIDSILVEQYLAQMKVAADEKEVDKKLEEMKTEAKKAGKDFAQVLQQMKVTEAEVRGHLMTEIRWEKFAAEQGSEAVLKQQFEANKDMFNGTTVKARHILLMPPASDAKEVEKARETLVGIKKDVKAKVTEGLAKLPSESDNLAREKARVALTDEAFATAAKEKSVCPSKAQGGDVGWFQRTGIMVEPFARAAFGLKPYTISDVVQTRFGLHLILVTERKDGQEVTFEKAKGDVRDYYFDRLREAVVAQMRPRSKIEIMPVRP